MHGKFIQEWSTSLSFQTGSVRLYKSNFSREKYLDFVNCYQPRKVITISKLRLDDAQKIVKNLLNYLQEAGID